jgi:acetate kinase
MPDRTQHILAVNTGSSSLKISVYALAQDERRLLSGLVDRIGSPSGRLRLSDAQGKPLLDQASGVSDHGAALNTLLDWARQRFPDFRLDGVGHRVVHGGMHYREPRQVTPELLTALRELIPIAPEHLPQAVQTMEAACGAFPDLPQVACFDTSFHRHMPRLAQLFPLPRKLADEGVVRYGFHGLSYEYILQEMHVVAPKEARGRLIIAHLGNGASMAAVRDGVGIDTTMGFTPTGGLMMGTRCGDLDPGALLHLLMQRGRTPAELHEMVNRESGLLGVSGISADMRDLLTREATDAAAAEAVALFCYQARKFVGALTAALGGLDSLVFTGGMGEHAPAIRQRIADGLEYLGIRIDPRRNEAHAPIVSAEGSPVTVRVLPTNEDLMLARHTRDVIRK